MEDFCHATFRSYALYRSTVGFDRLAQLFDSVAGADADVAYPPYNIERLGRERVPDHHGGGRVYHR